MANLHGKVLDLVTVSELMGNDFYVPDYQRGYRWTKTEVTKLLKDLSSFFKTSSGSGFYCMQPLVVYWNDKESAWEVIDGQQRLTTLFLILQRFDTVLKAAYPGLPLFTLKYQSRPGSETFLKSIDKSKRNDNIDYYHIVNALESIEEYDKDGATNGDICGWNLVNNIINDDPSRPKVKFIWYDVTDDVKKKGIAVEEKFSNLNIGKISLTNAELIKALFLTGVKTNESEALRISTEWDNIEHSLQEPELWAFIYGIDDGKYPTRIEFLFDIVCGKKDSEENEYFTFDTYSQCLDGLTDTQTFETIKEKWKEISDEFYLIKGWFNDRNLYHLIGYLRYLKNNISDIKKEFNMAKDLDDYYARLREKTITETLKGSDITKLIYGSDSNVIRKVLLLFNVLSVVECKETDDRFSFSKFYSRSWDIEHINSQTPKDIKGDDRSEWIYCIIEYFSGVDFYDKKKAYDKNPSLYENDVKTFASPKVTVLKATTSHPAITAKKICDELIALLHNTTRISSSAVYSWLIEIFNYNAKYSYTDFIGNLVLLDSATNRGYHNSFFPVKRKWINRREREGVYILPCTKNVFEKNYSKVLFDLMNWNDEDAESYTEEISNLLEE